MVFSQAREAGESIKPGALSLRRALVEPSAAHEAGDSRGVCRPFHGLDGASNLTPYCEISPPTVRIFSSHLEPPRKDGHEILFRFLHLLSEGDFKHDQGFRSQGH